MKKIKLIIIGVVIVIVIVLLWRYINSSLYKSKASTDKVNITYSSAALTAAKSSTFNLGIILNAENAKKISAVDLSFKYDSDNKDLIDYSTLQFLPDGYFDEKVVEATSSADGAKILHLVLTAKKAEASLSASVTLNLSFKAKNTDGITAFGLTGTGNKVIGTTADYSFDLTTPSAAVAVTVGAGGPTNTPTPTTTTATGSASLTFKVKFQGISGAPATTTTQAVKVTVKKQETVVDERTINFTYTTGGVWQGTGYFNVPSGTGYTILIKGPKHVQKKICDATPLEATGAEGTYTCATGALAISSVSTFDFSGITLLAGDLPQQDGVVNSYDISLVRNNLGKTDSDSLSTSDINSDGRVNTQDYSLIIYVLSIRTDEE